MHSIAIITHTSMKSICAKSFQSITMRVVLSFLISRSEVFFIIYGWYTLWIVWLLVAHLLVLGFVRILGLVRMNVTSFLWAKLSKSKSKSSYKLFVQFFFCKLIVIIMWQQPTNFLSDYDVYFLVPKIQYIHVSIDFHEIWQSFVGFN